MSQNSNSRACALLRVLAILCVAALVLTSGGAVAVPGMLVPRLVISQETAGGGSDPQSQNSKASGTAKQSDSALPSRAVADAGAQAIAGKEAAYRSASGVARIKAGIELARDLVPQTGLNVPAEQLARADAIVAELQGDPALDNAHRAALLGLRIEIGRARGDWQGLDLLAREIDLLEVAPQVRSDISAKLGLSFLLLNRFKESEAAYQSSLDLAGDTPTPQRFENLQKLGIARVQQGRFADAIENFGQAETVASRMNIGEDPKFLMRFGGIFLYTSDWQRAVAYLKRALAAAEANPDGAPPMASIYLNLGTAYNGLGNFEEAYRWFETAYAWSRDHGDPNTNALNNMGTVLREWGRFEEALDKFQLHDQLSIAAGDKEGEAVAAKNIGETLVRMGQWQRAMAPLERAYAIYVETDQRPKRLELYPVMIENLEALGRTQEGLRLMREFKEINDEVTSVESQERIANLESAIDLADKQKELAASERERLLKTAEIEKLQARTARARMLGIGSLLGLLVLAAFFALQIRDSRFKARAHRDLRIKSDEIESQRKNLEDLNEVVRRQSMEDALTGLNNRRFLTEWMAAAHDRRASADVGTAETGPMLCILLDLDHFKRINDQHGHAVGDEVLARFAEVLRECQRDSDVLVRWGGEEFVWLCPDTAVSAGPMLCERIRAALEARPIAIDGVKVPVTSSMGFAALPLWPDIGSDWMLTMRVADVALYQAKNAGRDGWRGYAAGRSPASIGEANAAVAALESTRDPGSAFVPITAPDGNHA